MPLASLSARKNPSMRGAKKFIATRGIKLSEDRHSKTMDSNIKKGEEFYLKRIGKNHYLLDVEDKDVYQFTINKEEYTKLSKEHTPSKIVKSNKHDSKNAGSLKKKPKAPVKPKNMVNAKKPKAPVKTKKTKVSDIKLKAKLEVAHRKEESSLAAKKAPSIASALKKNLTTMAAKTKSVAKSIGNAMSLKTKVDLASFYKSKSKGKEPGEREQKQASQFAGKLAAIALGAKSVAASGAMGAAASLILGGMFLKQMGSSLKSESSSDSETGDVVETMIEDFVLWFRKQDQEELSEKIGMLQAIEELKEKGYKAEVTDLEDEDLDDFSEDEEDEGEDDLEDSVDTDEDLEGESDVIEEEAEDEDFESESSVAPKLTFCWSKSERSKAHHLRTAHDINFAGTKIGTILSCPKVEGNTENTRCWVVTLEDGFNDAAYLSGKSEVEPFTIVKNGTVLLRNPARLTLPEAKAWVKIAVKRNTLV